LCKNSKKVLRTNKARFEISENRIVKEYFTTGDAIRDFELKKKIQENFKSQKHGAWTYKAVKVFDTPSENSIEMEYISAETIREIFAKEKQPSIYYHMGLWLGLLHKSTKDKKNNTVLTFNDYSDTNFLMNLSNKITAAIDPGNYKDKRADPGRSFVTGAFSVQRGVLQGSKNYLKAWSANYHYSAGYLNGADKKILPDLKQGFNYLCKRKKIIFYWEKKLPVYKRIIRSIEIGSLMCQLKFFAVVFKIKNRLKKNRE
jgi:hypothetical protein